jgi:hypothetical protein
MVRRRKLKTNIEVRVSTSRQFAVALGGIDVCHQGNERVDTPKSWSPSWLVSDCGVMIPMEDARQSEEEVAATKGRCRSCFPGTPKRLPSGMPRNIIPLHQHTAEAAS